MIRLIRLFTFGGAGFVIGTLVVLSLSKVFSADKLSQAESVESYVPDVNPPLPAATLSAATPSATFRPSPSPTEIPLPTPTVTPTPTPSSIPVTSEQLDSWFTGYSNFYSVDRQLLSHIAMCESKLNPNAVNGVYAGLYQFSGATWKSTRNAMNLDPNPQLRYNAEESIRTAAFKLSTQGSASWPNCTK
jgi:soluble lytic murein transglycosylase-like protein